MTINPDPAAVAKGVHDAFLTVLTTGSGFGADYPISREELLDAVTEVSGRRLPRCWALPCPPTGT